MSKIGPAKRNTEHNNISQRNENQMSTQTMATARTNGKEVTASLRPKIRSIIELLGLGNRLVENKSNLKRLKLSSMQRNNFDTNYLRHIFKTILKRILDSR